MKFRVVPNGKNERNTTNCLDSNVVHRYVTALEAMHVSTIAHLHYSETQWPFLFPAKRNDNLSRKSRKQFSYRPVPKWENYNAIKILSISKPTQQINDAMEIRIPELAISCLHIGTGTAITSDGKAHKYPADGECPCSIDLVKVGNFRRVSAPPTVYNWYSLIGCLGRSRRAVERSWLEDWRLWGEQGREINHFSNVVKFAEERVLEKQTRSGTSINVPPRPRPEDIFRGIFTVNTCFHKFRYVASQSRRNQFINCLVHNSNCWSWLKWPDLWESSGDIIWFRGERSQLNSKSIYLRTNPKYQSLY